jgi:hypothetical protein
VHPLPAFERSPERPLQRIATRRPDDGRGRKAAAGSDRSWPKAERQAPGGVCEIAAVVVEPMSSAGINSAPPLLAASTSPESTLPATRMLGREHAYFPKLSETPDMLDHARVAAGGVRVGTEEVSRMVGMRHMAIGRHCSVRDAAADGQGACGARGGSFSATRPCG